MKNTLQTFVLPSKELLVDKLISSGYSFASWRMPDQAESHFIISLESPTPLTEAAISELNPGFIANTYDHSHPIAPLHIQADIVVKGDVIYVDPRVNDSQLDRLRSVIGSADTSMLASTQLKESERQENSSFLSNVEHAVAKIKEGLFEKIVLSRYADEPLAEDFSLWRNYELLCSSYPNAFCSLVYAPGKGIWLGASPELLISDNELRFKTVALAGTKRLEQNQQLTEIAWTQKEIEEQAFVSRYIINCFKKIRLREFHEHGPKTVKAANLVHLKTIFEVSYKEVSFESLADQMLELLHPTSAVCGMPIENAKPWIHDHENYDRELYSGFLGPVNFESSTDLFVNLRCAKIDGSMIRYYAGAGITEDSDAQKEFEETEMKINVLRSILNQE